MQETNVLKTLYAKLVGTQAIVFFVLGAVFLLATERIFEGRRFLELATDLVIGAVSFSLLADMVRSKYHQIVTEASYFRTDCAQLSSQCVSEKGGRKIIEEGFKEGAKTAVTPGKLFSLVRLAEVVRRNRRAKLTYPLGQLHCCLEL